MLLILSVFSDEQSDNAPEITTPTEGQSSFSWKNSSSNLDILPWDLSVLFLFFLDNSCCWSLSWNPIFTCKWNIHPPLSWEEGGAFSLQRLQGAPNTDSSDFCILPGPGLALPLVVRHRNGLFDHSASILIHGQQAVWELESARN